TSGWQVVAGAFVVLMVGFGAAYSFAAFAGPLSAEFGTDHATASLIYALCGFATFTGSAVSGPLADRIGSRRPAAIGMLLVGAGLLLAAFARSFSQVVLCYGLLIGCGIGLAYVPALAAVQRWFESHRGLASGIAAGGVGVGTALVPPLAEALLRIGDWRLAFMLSGVAAAVRGVGGSLLLARSPESRGLALHDPILGGQPGSRHDAGPGAGRAAAPDPTPRAPEETAAQALRGGGFRQLYLGCLLVSLPVGLPFAHLVAFADALPGIEWSEALGLLGLVGTASILGRVLLGALADRWGRRATFLGCCWALSGVTLIWALARDATALSVFAFAFGITYGGFVALLPAFVADRYGRASAGTMIGLLYTSRGLALLLGPPLVGLASGLDGTGAAGAIGFAALLGVAGSALLARLPARQP
ncbi:MAG: MFS transporter, partial [Acetobacteraceae bacterium]|nr:MFS transporter [Acetobacteraceae bacterium]